MCDLEDIDESSMFSVIRRDVVFPNIRGLTLLLTTRRTLCTQVEVELVTVRLQILNT